MDEIKNCPKCSDFKFHVVKLLQGKVGYCNSCGYQETVSELPVAGCQVII